MALAVAGDAGARGGSAMFSLRVCNCLAQVALFVCVPALGAAMLTSPSDRRAYSVAAARLLPTSRVPARSGITAAARSSWCKTRRAAPNSQLCRAEVSPHFLRMCFQPLAAQRLCAQAAALLPVRTRCAPGAVERCRVLSCASNAGSRRRSPAFCCASTHFLCTAPHG